MNESTLFRPEVMRAQSVCVFGDVVVSSSPTVSLFVGAAVLVLLALVLFASLGHYTRKALVSGYLSPDEGLIKIYAPVTGVVIDRRVTEGQTVQAGEPLFVLSTDHGSPETPAAQAAAIASLTQRRDSLRTALHNQDELARNTQRKLRERLQGLEQAIAQVDAAARTQAQRLASAEETATRFRELAAKQYVSELQVREQREQALDQKARLESLPRDRIVLVRTLDELRRELAGPAPEAAHRRAVLARDIETLEQQLTEYESRRHNKNTTPTESTETTNLAERGQSAAPTAPLLSILPEQAVLEAKLLVPSRAIGFIEQVQRVALRYEAFPYQRYGSAQGRIKEIARTLITPGEVNLPVALREPVYRVTVSLDAQYIDAYRQRLALQSGMLLDADVWLDRRRIIEWVFDPLYSVMGRV